MTNPKIDELGALLGFTPKEETPIMTAASNTARVMSDLSSTMGILPSNSYAHINFNPDTQRIIELEAEVKALTARLDEFEKQWGWMLKEGEDV